MKVLQLWRYPVKSMAGERLEVAGVAADGVGGDRCWAVRDEERGTITDSRSLPGLLDIRVRYVGPAEIELAPPGAPTVKSSDPSVHGVLSEYAGRRVTLCPRRPAEDREHYRRIWPEDGAGYVTGLFGVDDLADLPDLTELPPEVLKYQTIPGTYFDAYPIHLVTTGDLEALAEAAGSAVDVRRLRPNLVVAGPSRPEWTGRDLRVAEAVFRIETACPRCVVISRPQLGLPADRELLRLVHRRFGHNIGLYASVIRPGRITEGDRAELLS